MSSRKRRFIKGLIVCFLKGKKYRGTLLCLSKVYRLTVEVDPICVRGKEVYARLDLCLPTERKGW